MNDIVEKIENVLIELRNSRIQCPKTEAGIRGITERFDMLFVGENLNIIYSVELRHTLREKYELDLSQEELNKLIPGLCKNLSMKCEPLYPVSEIAKGIYDAAHANYQITLY